jgi:hypothetical protein
MLTDLFDGGSDKFKNCDDAVRFAICDFAILRFSNYNFRVSSFELRFSSYDFRVF